METEKNTKQLNIELDLVTHQALSIYAIRRQRSKTAIVSEILSEFLLSLTPVEEGHYENKTA